MSYGTNAPMGLVPFRYLNGATFNGATNQYRILNTYASSIFTGDPVTLANDGTITRGAAGAACVGVFQGCQYIDSNGDVKWLPYWPGNPGVLTGQQATCFVIDDPNVVFSIQETDASGNAGTPLSLADVGLNANFLYTAGVTATGQSRVSLNNASEGVTDTLNLKILALDPTVPNAVGNFANWLVTLNNHRYRTGITGV